MRIFLLLFIFTGLLNNLTLAQQDPDSSSRLPVIDSLKIDSLATPADTLFIDTSGNVPLPDSLAQIRDSLRKADSLAKLPKVIPPEPRHDAPLKSFQGKESYFYALIALILSFGLIQLSFPKYFNDFSRVILRRSLKQRQLYEQMVQTPLPSLLLNIYFIVVGGIYVSILLNHFNITIENNFWLQALYGAGMLAAIYIVKFLGLKLIGWMLNMRGPADEYIFIVFLVNKTIALFLLPCLVFILLSAKLMASIALVLSFIIIGVLFLYRIFLSLQMFRNRVKVSPFHFFLYMVGFEIIPLLLIYKLLLMVF